MPEKETINPKKLFASGTCIKLHVKYPKLTKKLTAKDLGIPPSEIPEIFRLGSKRLIEKKHLDIFQSLEGDARSKITQNSYEFYMPGLRFVPKKVFPKVMEYIEAVKETFEKARDKFIKDYPVLREETLEKFSDHREAIEPHYPSEGEIYKKFDFQWSPFQSDGLGELTEMTKDDIDKNKEEYETLKKIQKELESETRKKVEKFVESTISKSRDTVKAMFEQLREKVQDGKINQKTVKKINAEIDKLKDLNFVGDDIYEQLSKFKETFLSKDKIEDKAFKQEITKQIDGIMADADNSETIEGAVTRYKKALLFD